MHNQVTRQAQARVQHLPQIQALRPPQHRHLRRRLHLRHQASQQTQEAPKAMGRGGKYSLVCFRSSLPQAQRCTLRGLESEVAAVMTKHDPQPNRAPIPAEIRETALTEFEETWISYGSASRAAKVIAANYGIGVTTLIDWARDRGIWPRTRASVAAQLEHENAELREEIVRLRRQLRGMGNE